MKFSTAIRTKPLREAMELYASKLDNNYPMDDFQYEDWEFVWVNQKCVCVRSRGGSKTKDFSDWLIFRVLRTNERWAWLACKAGQLQQAMIYVKENPFVKKVQRENPSKYNVYLVSGKMIRFGIVSTSNLGLRLDGIVYDEFEDLQPAQETDVYPQMAGMMTTSSIHKTLYLGTLWINALLNDYVEIYPSRIRPWDSIPHLVKAGMIQEEIDEGKTAEWELDMLYRCIATSPSGLLFPNLSTGRITYEPEEVDYGIDFGSKDSGGGVVIRGKKCYVVEEYEFELELHPGAYDFIGKRKCECEGGGYNDSEKYGEKSKLMIRRIGARKQPVTNKWKAQRQKKARGFDEIIVDEKACPNTYADLKKATFGPDGLYFKHPTKAPCHNLDWFLHAIGASKYNRVVTKPIETNLDYTNEGFFGEI